MKLSETSLCSFERTNSHKKSINFPGDDGGETCTIPNTEVKLSSADSTLGRESSRVGRCGF